MRATIAVLVAAAAIAAGTAGCGAVDQLTGNETCIVLAMGGNKLCGADAAAWCRSTDSIRATADQLDPAGTDPSSQQTCDDLESQYPE